MTSIFEINTDYFFGVLKKNFGCLLINRIIQYRSVLGRTRSAIRLFYKIFTILLLNIVSYVMQTRFWWLYS